jgi:uncharacterized protein YdcH (DUF465 family)
MADAQLPQDDVRAALLQQDETFRQLVLEHHALDEQIRHLSAQSYRTDRQRYEETALKKRKLAVKDRIESIVRTRYAGRAGAPPS